MPEPTLSTSSFGATVAAGRALAPLLQAGDVVLLTGDLGAGKTALAKGVAEGLDVEESVTSPTFNILLVHKGRLAFNHFDLYRLESSEQLEDIDFWGTVESGGVSLVEWGDRFPEVREGDFLTVAISILDDNERLLQLRSAGRRSSNLARAWVEACMGIEGVVANDGETP